MLSVSCRRRLLRPFTPKRLPSSSATSPPAPTTAMVQQETTIHSDDSSDGREQSLISLFASCSSMRDLCQVHSLLIRSGFDHHVFVVGRIISFCSVSPSGSMDYAVDVFRRIQFPDGFLWNTMIRGFGRAGRSADAFLYYRRMLHDGKAPDNFTLSFLAKICAHAAAADLGEQVHCSAAKLGLDAHVHVRNTLIHMYAMFTDVTTARKLFEEISHPDIIAWNTVIDGHVHCGEHKAALDMFLWMQRAGIRPDDATLVVVLSACAELGALEFGRWVHSLVRGSRLQQVIAVSNSLVDMYAKCGAIEEALDVFEEMSERDVVSWNAMILGLAVNGHAAEALRVFTRMMQEQWGCIEPNDVTFLGVLCACSHGGLVEQGKAYFASMRRDHRIDPTVRHYGCMTDLLGRAGMVREAYEMIGSMPVECNAVVWRTLLAACRVHGDLELGERVRRHLLDLEPDHSSDFVLLSQLYAGAGRWQEMSRVRERMRGRGVLKPAPGNSLISSQTS